MSYKRAPNIETIYCTNHIKSTMAGVNGNNTTKTPSVALDEVLTGISFVENTERNWEGMRTIREVRFRKIIALDASTERRAQLPFNGSGHDGRASRDFDCQPGYVITALEQRCGDNLVTLTVTEKKFSGALYGDDDSRAGTIKHVFGCAEDLPYSSYTEILKTVISGALTGFSFTWNGSDRWWGGVSYIDYATYSDVTQTMHSLLTGANNIPYECAELYKDNSYSTPNKYNPVCDTIVNYDAIVDGWCKDHMDDPFCSCYQPAPKAIADKYPTMQGLPVCWNNICSQSGYLKSNLRRTNLDCPNMVICTQNWGTSGDSNILSGNVQIQDCSQRTTNVAVTAPESEKIIVPQPSAATIPPQVTIDNARSSVGKPGVSLQVDAVPATELPPKLPFDPIDFLKKNPILIILIVIVIGLILSSNSSSDRYRPPYYPYG